MSKNRDVLKLSLLVGTIEDVAQNYSAYPKRDKPAAINRLVNEADFGVKDWLTYQPMLLVKDLFLKQDLNKEQVLIFARRLSSQSSMEMNEDARFRNYELCLRVLPYGFKAMPVGLLQDLIALGLKTGSENRVFKKLSESDKIVSLEEFIIFQQFAFSKHGPKDFASMRHHPLFWRVVERYLVANFSKASLKKHKPARKFKTSDLREEVLAWTEFFNKFKKRL